MRHPFLISFVGGAHTSSEKLGEGGERLGHPSAPRHQASQPGRGGPPGTRRLDGEGGRAGEAHRLILPPLPPPRFSSTQRRRREQSITGEGVTPCDAPTPCERARRSSLARRGRGTGVEGGKGGASTEGEEERRGWRGAPACTWLTVVSEEVVG